MPTGRQLRENERDLISAMLSGKRSRTEFMSNLDASTVEDIEDGGMGSIRFFSSDYERHLGAAIAEAEYTDDDGVLVSIVLNTDSRGRLYEIDFWKVDFSRLRRYRHQTCGSSSRRPTEPHLVGGIRQTAGRSVALGEVSVVSEAWEIPRKSAMMFLDGCLHRRVGCTETCRACY